MKKYIGIDIGGTNAKIVLMDAKGHVLKTCLVKLSSLSPRRVAAQIKRAAGMILDKNVAGVGVGIAGDIDSKRGVVRFSPNLNWHNVQFGALLRKALRRPVTIENDANAAAWGCYTAQDKKRSRAMLCVTLGTGVGGGLILGGKIYRGATGTAGEIGHMAIDPSGPKCSCGNRGCFEAMAGTKAIRTLAKRKLGRQMSPEELAKLADRGNEAALAVWRAEGETIGRGLAGVVNLLNPDRIYLAGGISQAWKYFHPSLVKELRRLTFDVPGRAVKILPCKNSQSIGAIGAGLLPQS